MKLMKHYELWCAAGAPCRASSCFPECHYARIIDTHEDKRVGYPEECPFLDCEKVICCLNPQIVCSPYFEHFPKGCAFEPKEDAE